MLCAGLPRSASHVDGCEAGQVALALSKKRSRSSGVDTAACLKNLSYLRTSCRSLTRPSPCVSRLATRPAKCPSTREPAVLACRDFRRSSMPAVSSTSISLLCTILRLNAALLQLRRAPRHPRHPLSSAGLGRDAEGPKLRRATAPPSPFPNTFHSKWEFQPCSDGCQRSIPKLYCRSVNRQLND